VKFSKSFVIKHQVQFNIYNSSCHIENKTYFMNLVLVQN